MRIAGSPLGRKPAQRPEDARRETAFVLLRRAPMPFFDCLVCGPLWVDYALDLNAPAQHGGTCGIEGETRAAGGAGWRAAHTLAAEGFSVALWSNPPGDDANGRVFRSALTPLPRLTLLQPFAALETPYRVTLRAPGTHAAQLWRGYSAVRVPLPREGELPPCRAVVLASSAPDEWQAPAWESLAKAWRKHGIGVHHAITETGTERTALVRWARDLLRAEPRTLK